MAHSPALFPFIFISSLSTITEKCLDEEINNELEKYSIISDYDNIVNKCEYYLNNENERETLKNNFYSNIKSSCLEIIKM